MEEGIAIAILFQAEIDPALAAPNDTAPLAASQLAAAANLGSHFREVVHTIQANGITDLPTNGVAILGKHHGLLDVQLGSNGCWVVEDITVHEGQGNVNLELVQGQLLDNLLVQDECVHHAQVQERTRLYHFLAFVFILKEFFKLYYC